MDCKHLILNAHTYFGNVSVILQQIIDSCVNTLHKQPSTTGEVPRSCVLLVCINTTAVCSASHSSFQNTVLLMVDRSFTLSLEVGTSLV